MQRNIEKKEKNKKKDADVDVMQFDWLFRGFIHHLV